MAQTRLRDAAALVRLPKITVWSPRRAAAQSPLGGFRQLSTNVIDIRSPFVQTAFPTLRRTVAFDVTATELAALRL